MSFTWRTSTNFCLRIIDCKFAITILTICFLTGCTGRKINLYSHSLGDRGLQASECINVSRSQNKIKEFVDYTYLTTNAGIVAGPFSPNLNKDESVAGTGTLSKMPKNRTFCMVFNAEDELIAKLTRKALIKAGLKLEKDKLSNGEFESVRTSKVHDNRSGERRLGLLIEGNARWIEKYFVDVTRNIEYGTDVRVFRDLQISFRNNGRWDPYFNAPSSGHNEAWILLMIDSWLQGNLER